MTKVALYDVVDGDLLLYVGISSKPKRRLWEHKARRTVPRSATVRVVRWFTNRTVAEVAERRRIKVKLPPSNIAHAVKGANRASDAKAAALQRRVDAAYASWQKIADKNAQRMKLLNDQLVQAWREMRSSGMSFDEIGKTSMVSGADVERFLRSGTA